MNRGCACRIIEAALPQFSQYLVRMLAKRRGFRHKMAKPRQHGQRHRAKLWLRNARRGALSRDMFIPQPIQRRIHAIREQPFALQYRHPFRDGFLQEGRADDGVKRIPILPA